MRVEIDDQVAIEKRVHYFSDRRDRQAAKTAFANLLSLGAGYGIRLAIIPLSLALLGTERYGLFLTVGSLVAFGGLADFGFAPGLVNVVARASVKENREAIRRYVSTAFAAYSVLAAVLGAAVLWAFRSPRLMRFLGAHDSSLVADAQLLVLVCGFIFAVTMLARMVPTACTALQEGYFGAWPHTAGSLLGLVLLGALYWSGRVSMLAYALVMGLPPLAAYVVLGIFFFGQRHPDLRPRLCYVDWASLEALWRVGWPLAIHQAANLAVLYSANILISNRLGPASVPQYSVPYALYAVLISVAWYAVSPYVPAYAEAVARGDFDWIRRRAFQTLGFTVALMGAGGGALVLLGNSGVKLWTGGRVDPSTGLFIGLACYSLAKASSNTASTLLTGLGSVRFMAFVYLGAALLYLGGSWLLIPRLGVLAVPIVGAIAHLSDSVLAWTYALSRLTREDSSQKPRAVGLQHES